MIIHDVEQGSPEWHALRLGIPTCSGLDKILTPKKLEISTSAPKYRNQLIAEWIVGHSLDKDENDYMERGKLLEPRARAWYEMHHDVEVRQVGFITRDDGKFGGSPDGLVDDDGGTEIKCPGIINHVGYMLNPDSLVAEYKSQVQGYFFLTDRKYWDLISFHPDLPPVVVRIERDEKYLAALPIPLEMFIADLETERAKFKKLTPEMVAA